MAGDWPRSTLCPLEDWPLDGGGGEAAQWQVGSFSRRGASRILDDAIKGHYAQFFMASQRLAPEELKDIAPGALPMARDERGVG